MKEMENAKTLQELPDFLRWAWSSTAQSSAATNYDSTSTSHQPRNPTMNPLHPVCQQGIILQKSHPFGFSIC